MVFGRRYRVTEKIGSGGMAEVYKAVDEVLGRTVAVKVLHAHYAADPGFVARFRQEAQAAANLSHPGIVNIYDWGQDDSTYYIVMEYVHGTDLKEVVTERGALDPLKVAEYGAQACAALSVAHGYDIIHRDIKPHNIVLTPDGTIKVMDFGIARAGNTQMTQTGSVLGTAHYVSPEQAQGRTLTATSDLYSLGVVLYELATGRVPFDADTPVAVALKQVNDEPVPPRQLNPQIPSGLEAVIMRALSKNPSDRYSSAEEMRRDLTRVASGRTVEAVPVVGGAFDETSVMPAVGRNGEGAPRVRPVPQKRNPWPYIAVAALLLLIGLGTAWALGVFETTPKVVVPELVGMTEQEVTNALDDVGLIVGPIEYEFSEEPSGTVLRHDPDAGTEVPEGSEVSIVFSRGTEQLPIPNLVGLSESEALAEIRKAGFELNNIRRDFSSEPDGTVIGQTPEAGTQAPEGALITVVISKGTELRKVPSVVGKSQGDARTALEAEGFKVKVAEEFSDNVDKGVVIGQSPDGNASLEVGGEVTIRVSKGKDKVAVPRVIGMTEDQAITTLKDAGFEVLVEDQVSPDDGIVITQDPIPGFDAARGSRVTIYVGISPIPDE
jgi:serine/threonine-protein kinase